MSSTFGAKVRESMLILQISPRNCRFLAPTPAFPCDVKIQGRLSPGEVFNGEPRTGRLPLHATGHDVQAKVDQNGSIRFESSGRIDPVEFQGTFFDVPLRVVQGVLEIETRLTSATQLCELLAQLQIYLPAFLSSATPVAVSLRDLRGSAGNIDFVFEFAGSAPVALVATTAEDLTRGFTDKLKAVSMVPDGAQRLWAAHRYLMQAHRLRERSEDMHDFAGERLLNLYKAIEVLFGRDAHELRKQLALLGVEKNVAEGLLVSLLYVRDGLDSGHPAMTPLRGEEYVLLHSLALRAENGVAWLLGRLCEALAAGEYQLPASGSPSKKNQKRRERLFVELRKHEATMVDPYGA